MKIFLLRRIDQVGYDEYDALVVVAGTEDEAREMVNNTAGGYRYSADWTDRTNVECMVINSKTKPGIILDSFNAG